MMNVTTKFKINPTLIHSIYIDVVLTLSIKKKSITQEHKKLGHPLRIELTYQLSKFSFSRKFHVLLSW